MARARFYDTVQMPDADGVIHKVANPQVTVYTAGTTTPLPDTLYAADTGGATKTNPFTGGPNGEVEFYLETAKRVSIKYDGAPAYGSATYHNQGVWPSPEDIAEPPPDPPDPEPPSAIVSPNGLFSASISNVGVFTSPGLLRKAGIYMVEDEGLVYGASTSVAAANSAAWAALIAKIAASGDEAEIHINGNLPMNGGINLHHGLPFSRSISVIGKLGRGSISWYLPPSSGTPYFDVGSGANTTLHNCGIFDLEMYHLQIPANMSSPTLRIGANAQRFTVERVHFRNNGAGLAALVAIECLGGFASGHDIRDTSIDGIDGEDPSGAKSIAIRFNNSANIDTPRFISLHTKGHHTGIQKNAGAGSVVNAQLSGDSYVDVCEYGFVFEPLTGAAVARWNIDGLWLSSRRKNLLASNSNGGSVSRVHFNGGDWFNATEHAALIGAGTNQIDLMGVDIDALGCNTPGEYAVDYGGSAGAGTSHRVIGNFIHCGNSAQGALRISSAIEPFICTGNIYRGVNASVPADNGVSKRNSGNAFLS
jgi:hypothetical protein